MRLLDLYCGGGGAAMGYFRAGFTEITGVDIEPQPRYPFTFMQGDALEVLKRRGHEFDMIHASPPCQAHTSLRHLHGREYPELIEPTRTLLRQVGVPWVIENVNGAPLQHPVLLCGTMFGLRVYRHRLFETSWFMLSPPHPVHRVRAARPGRRAKHGEMLCITGHFPGVEDGKVAMGIDWLGQAGLA